MARWVLIWACLALALLFVALAAQASGLGLLVLFWGGVVVSLLVAVLANRRT